MHYPPLSLILAQTRQRELLEDAKRSRRGELNERELKVEEMRLDAPRSRSLRRTASAKPDASCAAQSVTSS